MLVMAPFSLPPEGLPVLRTIMTSHSSMCFLSLNVDWRRHHARISFPPPPCLLPYIVLLCGSPAVFTLTFAENESFRELALRYEWLANKCCTLNWFNKRPLTWPKVCQSRFFPFSPLHFLRSHQNKLGLRGAHARLFNNMRHKGVLYFEWSDVKKKCKKLGQPKCCIGLSYYIPLVWLSSSSSHYKQENNYFEVATCFLHFQHLFPVDF